MLGIDRTLHAGCHWRSVTWGRVQTVTRSQRCGQLRRQCPCPDAGPVQVTRAPRTAHPCAVALAPLAKATPAGRGAPDSDWSLLLGDLARGSQWDLLQPLLPP